VRTTNRMVSDIRSVCPELLAITGSVDSLWFLRFLTSRDDPRKLAGMQRKSLLGIRGVGRAYADQAWQKGASFSPEVSWVGPMIISDAKRVLELKAQIARLEAEMEKVAQESEMAGLISTIPGFGRISSAELAGEIGTLERFSSEASLALYLGMCPLTNQSGEFEGTRVPRQVNRRAKAAMMNALAHHIRQVPESRAYYDKKRAEGKKHNQALRSLGRHMVRVIWSMLSQGREYELR